MPNGTLKLYNKLTNAVLVSLDILGTFNIEENLNETPSNMKVKVITTDTYREEFQVNTIAFHEDTNSWWVIKSDESSYLYTGEYEHEIQLTEYLEWYAYKHLTNCAFAPNTYTLEQMLERLFDIAKLDVEMVYPTFLSKDKIMPFLSFENFTVANAIKNVGRAINAIPKMTAGYPYALFTGSIGFSMSPPSTPTNGDYWYRTDTNQLYQRIAGAWVLLDSTNGITTPTIGGLGSLNFVNTTTQQLFISSSTWTPRLTFINRNGLDTPIATTLNTQFPIAYEKNTNSSDQFTTRSVSNISNAKSSNLVVAPKNGGFKIITPNSLTYNRDNAIVYLPSKIDKIDFIRLYTTIELVAESGTPGTNVLYTGYYTETNTWNNLIESNRNYLTTTYNLTNAEVNTAKNNLPDPILQSQFNYNDPIDILSSSTRFFYERLTIKNKFDYDITSVATAQERTCHWKPNTNELIMSKTFRYGLNRLNDDEFTRTFVLVSGAAIPLTRLSLRVKTRSSNFFASRVPTEEVLIQVGYYPIADIKVSIDNDNDAQDEKYFNQSGKVIDALSVSKLITSHTNDSVEGTKIRNARYTSIGSLLPVGQLVSDSNQLYVISQRSIDGQVKNGNEYYNVIYTLSRNRIARSENIVADSAVISYKTPDDNLVFRTQLYKDYLELSLVNRNQETSYLPISKALVFGDILAGTDFDFTTIAEWRYKPTSVTTTIVRHVANGSIFDLHKAKLFNINYQDNNVLGYRLDSTGATYVQTPILYTNNVGQATNYEFFLLDSTNLANAISHFATQYPTQYANDPIIPFRDLTQVNDLFYGNSVSSQGNYLLNITENNYDKDAFEIPVFEYMLQVNDDYSSLGNVIVGNDLFSTFTGTLRYHYVINNSTRITAENANKLYTDSPPSSSTNRRVIFVRDSGTPHILDLELYGTYTDPSNKTNNFVNINNVGIYATDGTTVKFLFAINDYPTSGSDSDIRVFINNWKI
jgi:hypothetical protein